MVLWASRCERTQVTEVGIARLVECWTSDFMKSWELGPQQKQRENFLLQSELSVLILIWCPFHPCVTAVACKRTRSFCQMCRWQVTPEHAYTLDPSKSEWADYAAVQAEFGNLSGNELKRNSSGNTRSQSSQLAEPLWNDPGLKRGTSCITFYSW